jgi:polyhydroxybutyrate depolymerase
VLLAVQPGAAAAGEQPPQPSFGCGTGSTVVEPNDRLDVSGESRSWRTITPPAYDAATPLPLVLWLHGQGMDAGSVAEWTDLAQAGADDDFVVVAPQGHRPDSGWMWEPGNADIPLSYENRDVAFIAALIDQLAADLCIDLARVYATGFSMGGHGVMALACALDDRIAAVAPTAMFSDLGAACAPKRPVPVLAIAQTADDVVFWDGGLGDFLADRLPWGTTKGDEPFFQRTDWSLSELERAEAMALRNGCDPGPESEAIAEDVIRMSWRCSAASPVELIVVEGGDHSWMIDTAPVSASDLMWAFFERFALP